MNFGLLDRQFGVGCGYSLEWQAVIRDRSPSYELSQQDQLRYPIRTAPDDCVLFKACPQLLGIRERQSENQEALFAGPMIARVLANALGEGKAALTQFM